MFDSIFRFLRKGECLDFKKYQSENSKELELKLDLENPKDGRAWWAAVSGVAQSWT